MVEPPFRETLHCFHHILGGYDPSRMHQKAKPSELSVILAMTKTSPTRIFQYLMSNFCTILGNISQIIQVSVSSTPKYKKSEWRAVFRWGYPGRITEEGGTSSPGSSRTHLAQESSTISNQMQKVLQNYHFTMCFCYLVFTVGNADPQATMCRERLQGPLIQRL